MRPFQQYRKILAAALAIFVLSAIGFADRIAWVKNFDAAVKQASREKKYIFLDVSASW